MKIEDRLIKIQQDLKSLKNPQEVSGDSFRVYVYMSDNLAFRVSGIERRTYRAEFFPKVPIDKLVCKWIYCNECAAQYQAVATVEGDNPLACIVFCDGLASGASSDFLNAKVACVATCEGELRVTRVS